MTSSEQNRAIAAQKAGEHYRRAETYMDEAKLSKQGPGRTDSMIMAQTHALLAICNMLSAGFERR